MKATFRRALVVSAVAAAFAGGPTAASAVTLTAASTYALVGDGAVSSGNANVATSFPWVGAVQEALGPNTSLTSFSITSDGFEYSFDNVRGTTVGAYARSQGVVDFTPTENVRYAFAGIYASDSPDPTTTSLEVQLEYSDGQIIFRSQQISTATPYESFVLGGTGGDLANNPIGELEGILAAGQHYRLSLSAQVAVLTTAASLPARGTGYVSLTFVAEPSVSLLLIAGATLLMTRRAR